MQHSWASSKEHMVSQSRIQQEARKDDTRVAYLIRGQWLRLLRLLLLLCQIDEPARTRSTS
jgi:hypothetical protein